MTVNTWWWGAMWSVTVPVNRRAAPPVRLTIGAAVMDIAAASAQSRRRANEDNFLVLGGGRVWTLAGERPCCPVVGWPPDRLRIVVVDGMGGHQDGALMAEGAVAALAAVPPQDSPAALREAIQVTHRLLLARAGGAGLGGCTLVMADVHPAEGRAVLANVGDSRSYFRHAGQWHRISTCHGPLEFRYRDGDVGEQEYRQAIRTPTNRLAQALGYGSFLAFSRNDQGIDPRLRLDLAADLRPELVQHADVVQLNLAAGDDIVLVSDGMLVGGGMDDILQRLGTLGPEALPSMVAALAAGPDGHDNATALMLRMVV